MVTKNMIEITMLNSLRDSRNREYCETARDYARVSYDILHAVYVNMGSREKMHNDTFFKEFIKNVHNHLVKFDSGDGANFLYTLRYDFIPSFDAALVGKIRSHLDNIYKMARVYNHDDGTDFIPGKNYWPIGIEKAMELISC